MAYHDARQRVVLFAGRVSKGDRFDDTWEYDGSNWQPVSTEQGPSDRVFYDLSYDEGWQQIILFGGRNASYRINDTWGYGPAMANLIITKTDNPDPVVPGAPLTYTLTVTNTGPSNATAVIVSDTLPLTVTFASSSPSQGTCGGINVITCSLGAVTNGGSVTVTIVVTPTASGPFTNTASVTSGVTDPNMANNSATVSTTACYDFNGDGQVDTADIMAVASRWRCKCEDACYDPRHDMDADCDIDVVDIMRVVVNWGNTCQPQH